ncbi:unnamed protein product [Porites lobata]|uniref:Zinc-ribbon domain-containing protein n=1 Tax=Porites lobata TaxID=104759 RepID=A0ABN8Q2I7_9CNID|nr:unnamed protein product [Porites lobata]
MFSDASQRAWGAVLVKDGLRQQIRDYWIDLEGDINTLEARALCNALSSFFFPSIRNARIDVWTDNATLRAAWENGGCRSSLVNQELKKIEEMSRAGNFVLHLKYIERPWKPACRCPACSYPNDSDANFCQACGTPLSREPPQGTRPHADMPLINKRFTEFQESYRNKPYERQKDSLEVQLSSFLCSLVPRRKFLLQPRKTS